MKNQITIVGNILTDPQVTDTGNGAKVARFQMKGNRKLSNSTKDGWYKLFAWGNVARFIELYAKRGKQIAVTGRQVKRTYLNETGRLIQTLEIEVQHVVGL
ncbi:MAG: hypothetical protein EP338_10550 [Bacteroidetes bacterium]|nr:MAG: hypothetical protein EP338_10550 [Bacteroidota bacterium]